MTFSAFGYTVTVRGVTITRVVLLKCFESVVLLTTANSPDLAIPSYNYSRYSFVFFFTYTAFGIMFMMNILLASIFNAYVTFLFHSNT